MAAFRARQKKAISNGQSKVDAGIKIVKNGENDNKQNLSMFRIPKKKQQNGKKFVRSGLTSSLPIIKHHFCQCQACLKSYKSRQMI